MMSRLPYRCSEIMKRWPYWCTNKIFRSLTLFLCKRFLLFQKVDIDAGHVSENALYPIFYCGDRALLKLVAISTRGLASGFVVLGYAWNI